MPIVKIGAPQHRIGKAIDGMLSGSCGSRSADGVAISDQQTLRMYAEVAFRDIRYVKGDGADIGKCDDIAIFAIRRILQHMERYPADEE